jgi:translation initiation factor IF-1
MAQKEDKQLLTINGVVTEVLPGLTYKVRLENGLEIKTYLSGKMKMNKIRIIEGDKVKIEMSPYDLTNGRITYRL